MNTTSEEQTKAETTARMRGLMRFLKGCVRYGVSTRPALMLLHLRLEELRMGLEVEVVAKEFGERWVHCGPVESSYWGHRLRSLEAHSRVFSTGVSRRGSWALCTVRIGENGRKILDHAGVADDMWMLWRLVGVLEVMFALNMTARYAVVLLVVAMLQRRLEVVKTTDCLGLVPWHPKQGDGGYGMVNMADEARRIERVSGWMKLVELRRAELGHGGKRLGLRVTDEGLLALGKLWAAMGAMGEGTERAQGTEGTLSGAVALGGMGVAA